MNALILPTKGNVHIFNYVITPNKKKNPKLKGIRKKVGFVFQFPEYQLFEETVLKDIMFAPQNFGYSQDDAKTKALEIAKILKIDDEILSKSPFNLSGGQMRKVAIAGILSYDPDILLLDEPTRGLDPQAANEIMDIFYDIHKKTGKTIIMITHNMNIVYKYASRVIAMNDTQITFDGNKEELFSTNAYLENNLSKPDVLNLIDYLNSKLGYKLSYDIHSEEELLERLVKINE
jgi:energy-coupling factor transport system ATP-binding protein